MFRVAWRNILIQILGCTLLIGNLEAQIVVTPQTAQNLIENVLVGSGVQVSNITFNGFPQQIAAFNGASATNLGLGSGIVMTTGNAPQNVAGPNLDDGQTTSPDIDIENDPDLNQIISSLGTDPETHNLCSIEFDFIPAGDSIRFKYVFGSDEYNEWVCGDFFDAFGFFLSGPGINGIYSNNSVNLAVIPGTSLPVGINTINNGSAGGAIFFPNCPAGGLSNAQYYIDNQLGSSLEMDGFTRILTALARVQCGETYHIKLIIANGGDTNYDSWVFLEAQSLTSVQIGVEFAGVLPDNTLIEGCGSGSVVFRRTESPSELVLTTNVSGTAIPGTDYSGLPSTVTFPAGVDSVSFPFQALPDALNEGEETVVVSFEIINECGDTVVVSTTIIIREPYELTIVPEDTTLQCPQITYTLNPVVSGGFPPYQYEWEYNNLTTPTITVPVSSTDTFHLKITDASNCVLISASDTIVISLNYDSVQTSTRYIEFCNEQSVTLGAPASAGKEPYEFSWEGFGTADSITVSPIDTTVYYFSVTDACAIIVQDSFLVFVSVFDSLQVSVTDTTICKNGTAVLKSIVSGGAGYYSYSWIGQSPITPVDDSVYTAQPTTSADYYLAVTDFCGKTTRDTLHVLVEKCELIAGNAISPNGDGVNDFLEFLNIANYPANSIFIFNRWGNKLFEQSPYLNAWPDKSAPSGTYFFILDPGDGSEPLKGYFYVFTD